MTGNTGLLQTIPYGLGLTRSGRWGALHRLFSAIIERQHSEPVRLAEALFLRAWKGGEGDTWKQIEGLEQRKTPLSDYLFMLFSEWGKPFMGLAPDFELIFERYEMLAALAFLECDNKEVIQQTLAGDPHNGWALMPVGRSSWHSSYASRLISELQAEPMKAALMRAGFAKNDAEFVDLFIENFKRIARRVGW